MDEAIVRIWIQLLRDRIAAMKAIPLEQEQKYTWRREGTGLIGTWTTTPNIGLSLARLDDVRLVPEISAALSAAHPILDQCVGCPSVGFRLFDIRHALGICLGEIWSRHQDFNINDGQLDAFVREFADALSQTEACFKCIAPLINFRLNSNQTRIDLTPELWLHRYTDDEITEMYAPDRHHAGVRPIFGYLEQWGLCTNWKEAICTADWPRATDLSGYETVYEKLERVVLALRCFKDGPVGLGAISYRPTCFTPQVSGGCSRFKLNEYVPEGGYTIAHEEIGAIQAYVKNLGGQVYPALRSGMERLSTAAIRRSPEDAILDSVIGLEAILLHSVGDSRDKGELKYRLSVRYASLKETSKERHQAFKFAKTLYDWRCTIAHGNQLKKDECKLDGAQLSLHDAAIRCRNTLRELIQRFAACAASPEFKNQGYWEELLFGR